MSYCIKHHLKQYSSSKNHEYGTEENPYNTLDTGIFFIYCHKKVYPKRNSDDGSADNVKT
jgi:hypothetical protein